MAQKISRGAFHSFGVLSVLLLLSVERGNGFEFRVGGWNGGWTVPADPHAPSYNQWAEKNRFQIGDSILFVYDANHDSVLHVTKDDYANCNTGSHLEKFTDGHTVYQFNQSGPHYFISGVAGNCQKNEKLVVVVLADRTTKHNSNGTAPSPAPSLNKTAPSPAPTVSPPSPAPAVQEPPSPPPSGEETNTTPAPAPAADNTPSHPKNGAAEIAHGVLGMVATIGASLVLGV